MIDSTTHENVKGYYATVPYTPYSSGSLWKNLFSRLTERTPESLLKMHLRVKEKISVHESKAALERQFDIKKTILDTQENEYNKRKQEHKARLQQLFREKILPPIKKPEEQEKRIEISDEFYPSSSSSKDASNSDNLAELEENKSESVYTKIQQRNFNPLRFKNPSVNDHSDNRDMGVNRKSLGTSSSSFLETEQEKGGSVANFNQGRLFKGVEQSEIAKQGGNDSDITSTIRGAINQITYIVEAQQFKFNKKHRLRKERSDATNNIIDEKNKLNTERDDQLFKIVSYQERNNFSPKVINFSRTEKRPGDPLKTQKHKSEAGMYNPYQLQQNIEHSERTPTEYKKLKPIELDLSTDSIRRKEFNRDVSPPIPAKRI